VIELLSVNVGLPALLGLQRGKPVSSAIRKTPVTADIVSVSKVNIEGDRQADLRVHGGPDKAIFAYPAAHLTAWGDEYRNGEPLRYGLIGENLTIGGIDERDVRIGDIWRWGSVRLQICQPRYPCYKLAMTVGEPAIIKRFLATARSGWYLRVLTPGEAPVGGPITIEQMDRAEITVDSAARAAFGPFEHDRRMAIANHSALAASWRANLLRMTEVSVA
jgi:MOSC domain-containing protein YiiM